MIESGKDVKVFTGTMDQDTEARYLKENNYRYLLNGRTAINSQGTFGAVEDVMGNVLVSNPNLPPGTNKVIGTYEDIAGQSCIYFVYNSNGFHGIYRWYANRPAAPNGVIEVVYRVTSPTSYNQFNPNPLDFQQNALITGVNLVDNLLCWTDNHSGPKMINIDRANETNKRRKFNLYFNKALYDRAITPPFPGGLNFTINVYQEGVFAPVAVLSWADVLLTSVQDSVALLYAAYLATPAFQAIATITNEVNYVDIEINSPGIYTVEFVNNSFFVPPFLAGYVTPDNFYPDITNTTVFYDPTSYQLIERTKYPPMCSLDGIYDPLSPNGSTFLYEMDATSGNAAPVSAPNIFHTVATGISNVISDAGGVITPGVHQTAYVVTGQQFPGTANAYISNSTAFVRSVNVTISITQYIGPVAGLVRYYIGPRINPTSGNSVLLGTISQGPGNQPNTPYVFSGVFSLQPFTDACIWAAYSNSPSGVVWYTGPNSINPPQPLGVCTVSGSIQRAGVYNPLTNLYPSFRARYIYKDEQRSVYGAISECIITDVFYKDRIILYFADERLRNVNLAADVKSVVLSVSLDNNTTWFDFDTLDRWEWIGDFNQKYIFDNINVLIPVPPSEAILPYYNVPLLSKSQEYIDDRIWDGAVTTGYDKVNVQMSVLIKYESINTPFFQTLFTSQPYYSVTRWKRGWKGIIGIVYYDDSDRKCAVCIDPVSSYIEIPNYNQETVLGNGVYNFDPAYIEVLISNNPPDWATKYHLVRTSDLSQTTYLMMTADKVQLVDAEDNVVAANLARYIKIDLSNIIYYTDKSDKGTKINYTFVSGDRVKFIQNAAGVLYTDNDYEIAYAIANEIYIVYDASISVAAGALMELYTPRVQGEREFYYEFDTCYKIETINVGGTLYKIHTGNIANQIPNQLPGTQPAILETKIGDVWYRSRQLFYNTYIPVGAGSLPPNYVKLISSNTPSDYTELIVNNNGRINLQDLKGKLYQPTGIIFSNKYISNTEINGLNAVEPLSTQQYSTVYGDINKMQVVNNDVLKLIFGNSFQLSIYVSQGVIRQSQGSSNLISISDEVAGNSHIIQRTLGTITPESVIVNDEADMFGWDENEGIVWVSSGNGLIQISDKGLKSVFRRYAQERLASGGVSETPAVYDLYHDEYIITLNPIINPPNGTPSFPGYTIAYNKQKAGWTAYYSFIPEYYGRVRNQVISFRQGQLYLHDRSPVAKNFYGVQYTRELTYLTNKDFPKVRDFKAISINGIGLNDLPTIRVLPFEGYPNGMLSLLTKRFFKVLEGVQYAYFQKDRLTPGLQANQINALANGRNLKGQVLEVTLVNNDTTKSSIYSSEILYFYSEHS